jgi:hypothetical protein
VGKTFLIDNLHNLVLVHDSCYGKYISQSSLGKVIDVIWRNQALSDKALGGAMLFTASIVFVYYTIWAILLVRPLHSPG